MNDVALLKYRLSEVFKSVHAILTEHAGAEPLVGGTLGDTANLWTFSRRAENSELNVYTSSDVCVMLAMMKLARIHNTVSVVDSFKDAIGYLALGLLAYFDEHEGEVSDFTRPPEDDLCSKE